MTRLAFSALSFVASLAPLLAIPVSAQLSSALPGLTTAGVPTEARTERRITMGASFMPNLPAVGDEWLATWNLGYSISYRVFDSAELGVQFTWADVTYRKGEATEDPPNPGSLLDGHFLYGLRVGAKYRAFSSIDLEGNGLEGGLFVTFQPEMASGFSVRREADSTTTSGLLSRRDGEDATAAPNRRVSAQTEAGVVLDYRARRFLGSASVVVESSTGETVEMPLTESYSSISPRIGASYRVTGGLAAGLVFWGSGSPPWSSETRIQGLERNTSSFGVTLTFGGIGEPGTDLVLSTPTGKLGESVRVYFRSRSFR